jgi:hypothetical protein
MAWLAFLYIPTASSSTKKALAKEAGEKFSAIFLTENGNLYVKEILLFAVRSLQNFDTGLN